MDIEALKLVLATVKDVSGVAAWVAVLFACKGYFSIIVGAAVGVFGIKKVSDLLMPFCRNYGMSGIIMRRLGIVEYINESEQRQVMELIELGLAAKKEKKGVPVNFAQHPHV
jgi:hypothetical protein